MFLTQSLICPSSATVQCVWTGADRWPTIAWSPSAFSKPSTASSKPLSIFIECQLLALLNRETQDFALVCARISFGHLLCQPSMWKCASVKTCFEKGSKASETKWNDCDTFCDEYLSPLQLLPVFIKRVQCQCLEVPQQQNGSHLSNECFSHCLLQWEELRKLDTMAPIEWTKHTFTSQKVFATNSLI